MKKKSKKQNIQRMSCSYRVDDIGTSKGEIKLPANKIYKLYIEYPFSKEGVFDIKTGKGLGVNGLLPIIKKSYEKHYIAAKKDKENGYWHTISDLFIEEIYVNHTKKEIYLAMGS